MLPELAIRPSFNRFRHIAGLGAAAVFGFGLLVLVQVLAEARRSGAAGGLAVAGALLVLVGPMLGGLALYFYNYRLFVGDGYLGKVTLFGRRRVWRRADLRRILHAESWGWGSSSSGDARMHQRYLLLDRHGKLIAEIPAAAYAETDVRALFERLEMEPSRLQYLDDTSLGRYYPEPLGSMLRHPIWTGVMAAIVIVAGLIAAAILTTPPNER